MVEEEGFASWYRDELLDDSDSVKLVVDALRTLDRPLGANLFGEGNALSLTSLSLSRDSTMCLGLKRFNPFLDFSSSTRDTWLEAATIWRGKTTLAAVAAALVPIRPFRYCWSGAGPVGDGPSWEPVDPRLLRRLSC